MNLDSVSRYSLTTEEATLILFYALILTCFGNCPDVMIDASPKI